MIAFIIIAYICIILLAYRIYKLNQYVFRLANNCIKISDIVDKCLTAQNDIIKDTNSIINTVNNLPCAKTKQCPKNHELDGAKVSVDLSAKRN